MTDQSNDETYFSEALAKRVLQLASQQGLKIATAESCTGGMIIASLTDIAGSSNVVDRGFITYSNEAKNQMLDVPVDMIETHGAVSSQVAGQMAYGAITNSMADLSVSVTGIAGPSGGTEEKPVGLVWFGLCVMGQAPTVWKCEFGALSRPIIREKTVIEALTAMRNYLESDCSC